MRTQSYLRFLDVQKYLKKQYDVALDILESYYSLLREGGMTWIKTHS
jgi:transposase